MKAIKKVIQKIISGGQTGADQGALQAAIWMSIPHGGWCPKGRRSENGAIPDLYSNLKEHSSPDYPPRTLANVKDSDGTIIFTFGPPERGSALTIHLCKKEKKPWIHIDLLKLNSFQNALKVSRFIMENRIKVLNVAGNRESKSPGIHDKVRNILIRAMVIMSGVKTAVANGAMKCGAKK
ncbi:MAG: hypothetical protein HC814_06560 [Rhodobacteraceae bacterium]|nr:hypothetical protein [Paracoccaceae bacterium]